MRSIIVLALLAACSKAESPAPKTAAAPPAAPAATAPAGADRPASVSDDMVASADRVLVVLTKTFDDVAAAGKDCKAIAAAFRKNLEPMKAIAPEANKLEDIKDPDARKWLETTYGPRFAANQQKMQAVMACKDDADVQAALGEMKTAASAH